MGVSEVLVSVDHEDGAAGVLRDARGHWLYGYLGGRGGTGVDQYRGAVEGLIGDRTAEGGLLPPGAVGAEVVSRAGQRLQAAAARGAWVVVLDEAATGGLHPTRFFDSEGHTVGRPLPDDWPRSAVDDLSAPCPACGATAWEEAVAIGDEWGWSEGPQGREPTRLVVCRTCGHQEAEPWVVRAVFDANVDPEMAGSQTRAALDDWQSKARAALAGCQLPIFTVVGWQPRLNGYGSREDVIGSVLVEHRQDPAQGTREIAVTTQREEFAHASELQTAREALQHMLWGTIDFDLQRPRGRSAAANAVISRDRDRQVEKLAATSETAKMAFEVDGAKKTFEVARHGSAWGAARDADGLVIVIEARNVSPDEVRLRRSGIAELFGETRIRRQR